MSISTARLDRFLMKTCQLNRRRVQLLLAQKRVYVDGVLAVNGNDIIDYFSHVVLDQKILQANTPYYVMLNKPKGVVCATKDDKHTTVIDLLTYSFKDELHIVGRLDLNTSGLVLLTNDSRWSERLTSPDKKVIKRYYVELEAPISSDYITAFATGMYFAYEQLTTRPAKLRVLSTYRAEVELIEGRYHQIKRMFGRFQNKVLELERIAIGNLSLDETLSRGSSRLLSALEVEDIFAP